MKARGLRQVNGQWVDEEDKNERFYINLINDDPGTKLEVLRRAGAPPLPQPSDAAVTLPTSVSTGATQAGAVAAPGCGTSPPSRVSSAVRFVHPNPWAALEPSAAQDEKAYPLLGTPPPPPPAPDVPRRRRLRRGETTGCTGGFMGCACAELAVSCLGPQPFAERERNRVQSEAKQAHEEAQVEELTLNHLPAVERYAAKEGIPVSQALTELAGGDVLPLAMLLALRDEPSGEGAFEAGAVAAPDLNTVSPPEGFEAYYKPAREAPWQPSQTSKAAAKRARQSARRAAGTVGLCRRAGPTLRPAAVAKDGAPHVVHAIVDSGAEECVAPPGTFSTPVVPSAMSAAGMNFSGADGGIIKNHGRTTVEFTDEAGRQCGMHFHVAGVTQPLISVASLVDAGHIVVFGPQGGVVHHQRSGRKIRLPRVGKAFMMDMTIASKPEEEEGDAEAASAPRGGESAPAFRRPE